MGNFNLNNGMYDYIRAGTIQQKIAMLLEVVINIYCIFISVWYAVFFSSRSSDSLVQRESRELPIFTTSSMPHASNQNLPLVAGEVVQCHKFQMNHKAGPLVLSPSA